MNLIIIKYTITLILYQTSKKLVLVLATSILIMDSNKKVIKISCIYYLI